MVYHVTVSQIVTVDEVPHGEKGARTPVMCVLAWAA
jgi:hypothetical protein